ncbi:MAG: hypothetical protein ABIJ31_12820, partial [Pseudomonadota bacterium]
IKSYYTTDGSTPDNTDTEYTGAAIAVDGADGAAVTVKMISHDSSEDIYGSVGSATYTFDKANPSAAITAPAADAYVTSTALTVAGTANDGAGSGVSRVQVSIDNGAHWANATGTTSWTYAATLVAGANVIKVKVTDNAGNVNTITGSTITYYPPLKLTVGGTDVTGGTVYVPNTAGSNTKTITVSGGSGVYSTYTWLPATSGFGALTVTADDALYTAVIGATGTHAITVQDPIDTTVFTAAFTVEVVSFSATGNTTGYVGSSITITAQGNIGDVSWVVKSGADVAGTPVVSGNQNVTAKVTPLKAGTFQLTATDAGTSVDFDVPVVTVYTVPNFDNLPDEKKTVLPGASSDAYSVSGGDASYTWSVTGPSAVAGGNASTYTFVAPSTGNFAGTYTISAAESNTYSQTFEVYVPLVIAPAKTSFSMMSNAAAQPFTLTGAASATPYTVTVDSLDDALEYTPTTGTFNAQNTVAYAFDPSVYTPLSGPQDYSLAFEAQGLTAPPMVDITIVPVLTKDFTGNIVDSANAGLVGVTVTITSPAGFKGLTQTTDASGDFTFASLAVLEESVLGFKAQKTGYISKTFKSTELTSSIKLADADASVTGTAGAQAKVSLFDANGKISGPMDTASNGAFTFEFSKAAAYPVDYTITASAPGQFGSTTFTADAATYTPVVAVALAPLSYTVTGSEPAGYTLISAAGGGDVDFGTGGASGAFGTNTITLVITPVEDGSVIVVAPPVATTYTDTTLPIASGVTWQIDGLGDNCVTIPVPCSLADALAVAAGTKAVYYENSDTPGTWQTIAVDPSRINYDGDNSLIEVDICDWSSNVVGIGAASSSISSAIDDASCFISTLNPNSGNIGWMAMILVLASAVVFIITRKQKIN